MSPRLVRGPDQASFERRHQQLKLYYWWVGNGRVMARLIMVGSGSVLVYDGLIKTELALASRIACR